MQERRKYPRYGCCARRKFVARYENKNKVMGEIKDFSRGGIFFISKERLRKKSQLRLDLQISGLNQKIPASIQILWSEGKPGKYAYGARLTNISPGSKFDIMDLLYQDWIKTLGSNLLSS
ncbi:PilZ domain-containing protein [bacterium]|nr:PilZ domain-containing protein [bacterium]